ncbi:MAG: ABC transporter ATP-binding protein [Candidatus Woesearchaeota archaeon]|jgi:ABC-type branched-subunit amino acid transport system ATPase component|nr:ABC transporter ATP-binding protein [Candidatus Woesearchaeota archaeon]|tara:strand:- start:2608 stop:3291 length:684 start_codon:yes stop_codon:yes gene_type:complete
MLSIKSVAKNFGGVKAVNKCSFDIEENKITALIGPNGAGKTTLFNIISGLIGIDKGTIKLQNENITNLQPHKIANLGISRTFQLTKVFRNMSIKDNMLLAKHTSEEEIKKILDSVYLHKPLDTFASELSYGQQRLLEIARALLMPHSLLMLDEPTAGVNPKIRQELKLILKNLKKEGKTVLLIEHDMDFVMSVSDTIVVLNQGRVLKIGKPKQVVKDKKVLEAYLGK